MKGTPAIRLAHVSVTIGQTAILEHVDASIMRGHITALIGPNGAGKTTLLQAILGLRPYSGTIEFLSPEGKPHRPRIGYVPQSLTIDRQAAVTVLEFFAFEFQRRPVWLGITRKARENAEAALERLEAVRLIDRPLGRLSGGELQRVLLALALHRDPEILFLDEPVSGVDVAGGHLFCDVLESLSTRQNRTIVMVSHDLSVVSQLASHVLCLNRTIACR
ncbi:MAG TPA: metal ABC transporter ATP-binding protein, partial [Candidatus Ozemobacteraceae bacterium]|nr:metal ABC transporter ATP-binding protein [Candidatus Ozemobacteraceae bacterium]